MVTLAFVAVLLAQQVSPERIEPEQLPMPHANSPVESGWMPWAGDGPGTFRARPAPGVGVPMFSSERSTPSLMADEAYRRARVRGLLELALRRRGGA